jgi:hypothetical protein
VALRALAAGVALAFAFATGARAQCESRDIMRVDLASATFDIDHRPQYCPDPGCPPLWIVTSYWIYQETNAMDGLQRGGEQWLLHAVGHGDLDEDGCNDGPTPDRLWF